jgi:copper chaperone CopZ
MAQVSLNVPDINCASCERHIVNALNEVEGIQAVRVDVTGKIVHLEYNAAQIDLQKIGEVLDDEGYPVQPSA